MQQASADRFGDKYWTGRLTYLIPVPHTLTRVCTYTYTIRLLLFPLLLSFFQIDRGATLKWVSQFPAENEHLLPPLSNFSIVGMHFLAFEHLSCARMHQYIHSCMSSLMHTHGICRYAA